MYNRGRELEKLVKDIELALSGRDVLIKQNDYIPDIETGEIREIDISIRAKIGSMELLTIVECRDRKEKADARWIEQLDGKRKSIAAHKVVAVSRSGFTSGALIKAKSRNIETRTLKKLKQTQIRKWITARPIKIYHCTWTQLGGQIAFEDPTDEYKLNPPEINWLDDNNNPKKIFVRGLDGLRMSMLDVFRWSYWVLHGDEPEEDIDTSPKERWLDVGFDAGELFINDDKNKLIVKRIYSGFLIKNKEIPIKDISKYSNESNDIAHHLVWEDDVEIAGKTVPLKLEVFMGEEHLV